MTSPAATRERPLLAFVKRAALVAALCAAAVFLARWTLDPAHRVLVTGAVRTARWGPLLLGSALWFLTFGILVLAWGRSMRWWGTPMPDRVALRTFFLANVARYVPGTVWQFAGIAAMASDAGIAPVAATTGLLIQQLVLLLTGALWTILLAPAALSRSGTPLAAPVLGGLVALGLALGIVFVPRLVPPLERLIERRLRRPVQLPALARGPLAAFTLVHALGWIGYSVSFWLFAIGVLGDAAPSLPIAIGAYVSSYVVGILAVFAPGGLGVREGALVLTLSPVIGTDRAVLLSVASRVWLVLLELLGALALARKPRVTPRA